MKIAVIRRKLAFDISGGAERYTATVVTELAKRGHEITFFGESFSGDIPSSVKCVKVRKNIFSFSHTVTFAENVRKIINPRDFDVIFAICRYYPADIVRVTEHLYPVWMKMAYSWIARFNPRHSGILKLEKKVYSTDSSGYVMTIADMMREQVSEVYGYPKDRIFTIRNGVSRELFYPPSPEERAALRSKYGIPENSFAFLFAAATNFSYKGLQFAIRAFAGLPAELREKSILLVAGGDNRMPYIKLAESLGIPDGKVRFLGDTRAMRELYASADMFVFPSRYEAFGNVTLEAMSTGTPVLTTSSIGSAEIIRHGISGYVVDRPDNINAIVGHIKEYCEMDAAAREKFRQTVLADSMKCSWEKHVDELEKLLEKGAAHHRAVYGETKKS